MGTLIGIGCGECNEDIAAAEAKMALAPGYCSSDMFRNIPAPRPIVYFDGEDQTGKEVYALSLSLGIMLRNHLKRMPGGERRSVLCQCESGYVAVELWEGKIELQERPLAAFIRGLR